MLFAVTRVVGIYFGRYELEAIYATAFLIACLSMLLLSKWTVRSMMAFIAVVAVLFVSCKTARMVYDSCTGSSSYTVAVPAMTGTTPATYVEDPTELPVDTEVEVK